MLAEIQDRLPYEHTVYFGDTARVPYGVRDLDEVREFAFEIIRYLTRLNVKLVVVACNTATAAALEAAQSAFDVPIIGVIEPGARAAVLETLSRKVGVLATEGTVNSHAYARTVHHLDAGVEVYEQAAPRFVPMIEKGITEGPELDEIAWDYLQPLIECQVDALILGCTHYPLISTAINRILGPKVRMISSAGQTALEVGRVLSRRGYLRRPVDNEDYGRATFVCSEDPDSFATLGGRFLGETIEAVAPAAVI